MDKTAISTKNLARRSTTISAGFLFVVAATVALLVLCGIIWLTSVKSSTETLNSYGYTYLTYEGEVVEYNSYHYDVYYYSYDLSAENPEEFAKYKAETKFFDIKFNDNIYRDYMGKLWLIEIAAIIVSLLSLALAIAKTGPKDENGNVKLGWFDRIFVEVDIIVAAAATIGLYFVFLLAQTWLFKSNYGENLFLTLLNNNPNFETIRNWMDYSFGLRILDYAFEPRWILLVIASIGTLAIVSIDLIALLSIVRRIKARSFLRTTILGYIACNVIENAASSPALKGKVLGTLIGAVALMFIAAAIAIGLLGYESVILIGIGALVMIALICIFVPKQIGKYEKVRTGISELQKGNFTYKVPDLGNGELGRLASSVNSISEAQDLAIQKELKSQRLRTELISNVSHDIRTPLTSMSSYVDLLKKEGLDSPQAPEYVRIISEKTERLQKLTDDLFEAAKAASGDIPVTIEKLDMHAMVEQALAELDESINRNNIDVVLSKQTDNTMVYADGKLLWRVIENILTNVTKYSLSGTRAYMDIFEKDDQIILEVKNMSRDQLNISSQELLERFKRGDDSRNTEGSGLGLAIASDLTALMGGNFDISIDGDLFKAIVSLKKADRNMI